MSKIDILIFTQNVKIYSLINEYKNKKNNNSDVLCVTTNKLFDNEKEVLIKSFKNIVFKTFSDYLTDEEMSNIDKRAYEEEPNDYERYLSSIREIKNSIICEKIKKEAVLENRYLISDSNDLGLDDKVWLLNGYIKLKVDFYYKTRKNIKFYLSRFRIIKNIYSKIKTLIFVKNYKKSEIFVSEYKNKKYIFIGRLDRIQYRLSLKFKNSIEEYKRLNNNQYYLSSEAEYLTTWHEHGKCNIPDNNKYSVRWIQDGYLPPNYSHADYKFKPNNVIYYAWDIIGTKLFVNNHLPVEIMPFRKKIYIPNPIFRKQIKKVLFIASGSGDWTALKNRSDDDELVIAAVKIAKKYPNINFVYRCHPTWVYPQNVGVNSISRVSEYFNSVKLSNLIVSTHIPISSIKEKQQLSFSRTSLEEDLINCDMVFGEHSISMIDAALKKIPFASVNLTKRRNFFVSITELGFPHCNSIDDISNVLDNLSSESFIKKYKEAIINYNVMTDEEIF